MTRQVWYSFFPNSSTSVLFPTRRAPSTRRAVLPLFSFFHFRSLSYAFRLSMFPPLCTMRRTFYGDFSTMRRTLKYDICTMRRTFYCCFSTMRRTLDILAVTKRKKTCRTNKGSARSHERGKRKKGGGLSTYSSINPGQWRIRRRSARSCRNRGTV